MNSKFEDEIIDVTHAWDQAMVTNDAETIGQYMSSDWLIIGPDGSMNDKGTFLDLISSGKLSHNVMESHNLKIRVYGNTAIVTTRSISGGEYQGESFYLVERVSCVFVKKQNYWKCVLTHLSELDET